MTKQWINNIPPYAEEKLINQEIEQIQETLSKFEHLVPEGFTELGQPKKYWGSTEGLDKSLCERYTFKYNNKSYTLDITQELSDKLKLNPKENFFVDEKKVLSRSPEEGGITIKDEKEIFLKKSFTVENLEEDIKSYYDKIKELKDGLKKWTDQFPGQTPKQIQNKIAAKVQETDLTSEKISKLEKKIEEQFKQIEEKNEELKKLKNVKEDLKKWTNRFAGEDPGQVQNRINSLNSQLDQLKNQPPLSSNDESLISQSTNYLSNLHSYSTNFVHWQGYYNWFNVSNNIENSGASEEVKSMARYLKKFGNTFKEQISRITELNNENSLILRKLNYYRGSSVLPFRFQYVDMFEEISREHIGENNRSAGFIVFSGCRDHDSKNQNGSYYYQVPSGFRAFLANFDDNFNEREDFVFFVNNSSAIPRELKNGLIYTYKEGSLGSSGFAANDKMRHKLLFAYLKNDSGTTVSIS